MAVSTAFRVYVLDQLAQVSPVTSKPMFGGLTIFHQGLAFAIIAGDRVYLKADSTNRGDFESRFMGPFLPFGDPDKPMSYYELPEDVLEDVDELRLWVIRAFDVAGRAKRKTKKTGSRE